MDSGSAATLVDDPRGSLERLEQAAGARFEHLAEARRHTARLVGEKTAVLTRGEIADGMSIVVFGTWAREELKRLRAATREQSELWHEVRSIGDELQRALNVLLFDTALKRLAAEYAIF